MRCLIFFFFFSREQIQQIVSPRGNKISLLTKYPRSDNAEEDNVLNIFVTSDSKKQDLISELLGAGNSSGASKFYSEALQMYEGYLDEIFKALKVSKYGLQTCDLSCSKCLER
jgi:hypothetical protein